MQGIRVAAIDIGTNTVLLLVAERRPDGVLVAIEERAEITRLGEGVDRSRRLTPGAIDRTKRCLDDYANRVGHLGVERVGVVGTSAMRDAEGGDALREHVRARFGVDARTLTGEEEARLTFAGAVNGLELPAGAEVAVFDIGGGSTEVVLGRSGSEASRFARSFDLGSVRLTERFIAHDPPLPQELADVKRLLAEAFVAVPPVSVDAPPPIGVAGTITTLAAVALQVAPYDGTRVHGRTISRETLCQLVDDLAAMRSEERRAVPGMEPKRADVIVAGGLIALSLLERWQASSLVASDRGVRWGLAEELARPQG